MQQHPIAAAFIAAVRTGLPGDVAEISRAGRKSYDRYGPQSGNFALPNGWLVDYLVTATSVLFSAPNICRKATFAADAVVLVRSLLVRCAFADSEITPAIRRRFADLLSEPEGWEANELARMACRDDRRPELVARAMADRLCLEYVTDVDRGGDSLVVEEPASA